MSTKDVMKVIRYGVLGGIAVGLVAALVPAVPFQLALITGAGLVGMLIGTSFRTARRS